MVNSCMLVGGCRDRFLMCTSYCTLDRQKFGMWMVGMLLTLSASCVFPLQLYASLPWTYNWLSSLMSASYLGLRPSDAMTDCWFLPVRAVSSADLCNAFLLNTLIKTLNCLHLFKSVCTNGIFLFSMKPRAWHCKRLVLIPFTAGVGTSWLKKNQQQQTNGIFLTISCKYSYYMYVSFANQLHMFTSFALQLHMFTSFDHHSHTFISFDHQSQIFTSFEHQSHIFTSFDQMSHTWTISHSHIFWPLFIAFDHQPHLFTSFDHVLHIFWPPFTHAQIF